MSTTHKTILGYRREVTGGHSGTDYRYRIFAACVGGCRGWQSQKGILNPPASASNLSGLRRLYW